MKRYTVCVCVCVCVRERERERDRERQRERERRNSNQKDIRFLNINTGSLKTEQGSQNSRRKIFSNSL